MTSRTPDDSPTDWIGPLYDRHADSLLPVRGDDPGAILRAARDAVHQVFLGIARKPSGPHSRGASDTCVGRFATSATARCVVAGEKRDTG